MKNNEIKKTISELPDKPGIYKYYDKTDTIIYIGKAKNLKKRVSSYFSKKKFDNRKTEILVSKIYKIEYTLVNTELDALLLENSLIKEFKPKYNLNLKDDKSFPLIKITNEPFPRVFSMRNPVKDGSEYFGPYSSPRIMNIVLDLAKLLYPVRSCNLPLTTKGILSDKFRICLDYQIGKCRGPCENHETEDEYKESVKNIKHIFRGNLTPVKNHLKKLMLGAAKELKFEEAELFKNKLKSLDEFQARTMVVSHKINNIDVFNISTTEQLAFVNYLKISNGMIIQTQTIEYRKVLNEKDSEILLMAIAEMRLRYNSNAKEIILPIEMDLKIDDVNLTIPKSGDKLKLLQISMANLLHYKKEKLEQYDKLDPEHRINRLMNQMKEDLRLSSQPRYIECFDNSNIQGNYPVSACVVFKDGKASKKDYRIFNIKTVQGPDDFATMQEAISRRYKRLKEKKSPLPDLLIIDGGKGQLSSVIEELKKINLYGKFQIIGIAKRLEEIYYPDDSIPVYIDKKSETLKIIQQIRDEAHRFGISKYRNRHKKALVQTELIQIKGIGEETAEILLKNFKSIKNIKFQTLDTLTNIVGKHKSKILIEYFKNK